MAAPYAKTDGIAIAHYKVVESWVISPKRAFFQLVAFGSLGIMTASCGSNDLSTKGVVYIEGQAKVFVPTSADYQKAAISATGTLTRKKANNAQIAAIVDQATYEAYLTTLLNSQDFVQVMVKYHQELFQNLGKNIALAVAANDPAIFGAYAATTKDVPYSDILTGNYCVVYNEASATITQGPCRQTMNVTPAPQNAGVLTIPSLLVHDFGAQGIRSAARLAERFICVDTTAPDTQDPGRPYTEISPRYGGEMFGIPKVNVGTGTECFQCHGALTNRAVTFRNFDPTGSYDAARGVRNVENPFLYTPAGQVCPPSQQPACNGFETHSLNNSTYKGVAIDQVWDLGREMAADSRFNECAAIRFYNWVFAKENKKAGVPTLTLNLLTQKFGESNRSVKALLFALMSHNEIFIARQSSNGGNP